MAFALDISQVDSYLSFLGYSRTRRL